MYEGRASVEQGKVLGHENMGVVGEGGRGLACVKVGDRVSVPFNIARGTCRACTTGWTSFCTRVNTTEGMDGAAYGFANMGPYDGGQAEMLRVPFADFNLLELPAGTEHENDFTMLSDIFPTGWYGVVLAGVTPGDRVAVFDAGPVGLMAAHSAMLMGASQVFVVDQLGDRLKLATSIGATAIDFSGRRPDRLPGSRPRRRRAPRAGARQPDQGRPHHRYRRRRALRARGPRCQHRGRQGGVDRMGTGQTPVRRYNRQLARPDHHRARDAVVYRLARAGPGSGGRGLRPLRQARRGLDQGASTPRRQVSRSRRRTTGEESTKGASDPVSIERTAPQGVDYGATLTKTRKAPR